MLILILINLYFLVHKKNLQIMKADSRQLSILRYGSAPWTNPVGRRLIPEPRRDIYIWTKQGMNDRNRGPHTKANQGIKSSRIVHPLLTHVLHHYPKPPTLYRPLKQTPLSIAQLEWTHAGIEPTTSQQR